MRFFQLLRLTVLGSFVSLAAFAQKPPKTGDGNLTIVAFGNSITATRKTVNQVFAQRLPHLLAQKGVSATVINAGIGGSHTGRQTDHNLFKIRHALDRFESDVLARQPDLTIIGFGINDAHIDNGGATGPSRIPLEKYRQNLSYMVETLQKQGSKVILTVPNPLGQKYPEYQNERLQGYINTIREFARKYRTGLVDNNKAFRDFQNQTGVSFDSLMLDGVHPNDRGHELIAGNMAAEVLRVINYREGKFGEKRQVLQLNPTPGNPRNSEGDFVTLKDGRILFIYSRFTGNSSSDFAAASLMGRFSSDKGKTWTQEDTPIVNNEGGMNVMSVSLLRLQNGNIALFYARKNSIDDCIPLMRISTDEAKTWSEPIACITDRKGYFVLNNNRAIQLKTGRLLLPVALHETPPGASFNGKGRLFSYYSDDTGKTWKVSQEVANPDAVTLQEPGLISLKDNRLMMIVRTDAGVQYAAYSMDQGQTWSPAKPTGITSPVSPATIARIPSTGDLLMVWNNNDNQEGNPIRGRRTPLNIAVSKDEGQTWSHVKTLEADPDGWYCYTAIHFVGKKDVLLSYCAGNRPKGTGLSVTNVTRLSLDWVYNER